MKRTLWFMGAALAALVVSNAAQAASPLEGFSFGPIVLVGSASDKTANYYKSGEYTDSYSYKDSGSGILAGGEISYVGEALPTRYGDLTYLFSGNFTLGKVGKKTVDSEGYSSDIGLTSLGQAVAGVGFTIKLADDWNMMTSYAAGFCAANVHATYKGNGSPPSYESKQDRSAFGFCQRPRVDLMYGSHWSMHFDLVASGMNIYRENDSSSTSAGWNHQNGTFIGFMTGINYHI